MSTLIRTLSLATAAILILGCAVVAGSTLTVVFKDGQKVAVELPQDTSKISYIGFDDSTPLGGSKNSSTDLAQVIMKDTMSDGLGSNWDPLSCVGGDYGRFAKFEAGKLVVDVPAGNNWGKTGIMSKKPLFSVDDTMDSRPMKIVLDFDAARTRGYVACLSAAQNADVWLLQNAWFHWGVSEEKKKGFAHLVNTQNSGDPADPGSILDLPTDAPSRLVLSVSAGKVVAELPGGRKLVLRPSWLKSGVPIYLHVFSHPDRQGGAGSFCLDTVTVGR